MKKSIIFLLFILIADLSKAQKPAPARLIVRGDDMGFSHSGNLALMKSHQQGIQTSIEVIVPSPWFPEAVQLLKEIPDADVGIHLALTSEWDLVKWRPLTDAPSLRDSNGYFYPMVFPNKNYPGQSIKENNSTLQDIEKEFRAQIELALRHIPQISHVSAHMGCANISEEVKAMTRRLTKEYKIDIDPVDYNVLPFRLEGPHKTSAEKWESFKAAVRKMEPGKTYLFVEHPGLDNTELQAIHHIGYEDVATDRQGVTELFTNPEAKDFLQKQGVQLISYKDLPVR
ncbi:polysaccharide deacetylase family protein [Arundinibacter roseus]|uniref:ChbG/HpnK family deacetylase n=1 Tax=Arundinibacter roseus TaxID=2070510 RepID=A0A4V2XA13_9BACT|nr:polysaccharide deacetylase family protein [Arundinibacter roseus]TDB65895.1 ChbG/HpnK family deacetylase [Arundinibacter roseus]